MIIHAAHELLITIRTGQISKAILRVIFYLPYNNPRVVDLALKPIFRSRLVPNIYRGQICNLVLLPSYIGIVMNQYQDL